MAKDYNRKRQTQHRSSALRRFIMTLASFLGGYLVATVFDFTSLSTWVNKNVLRYNRPMPQVKTAAKPVDLPKPKFEFYTLLSKDNSAPAGVGRPIQQTAEKKVMASQPAGAVTQPVQQSPVVGTVETRPLPLSTPIKPPSPSSKGSYLIQIASFNKRQDAENLKASLVLKGLDVTITPIAQSNITWFRVLIGPFNSLGEAEKVQIALARSERMKGMIRKMSG